MTPTKIVCCLLFGVTLLAYAQRSWHHPSSPFRAVFEIKQTSNHPEGGTVIEVPHCGIGDPDGKDVYCFDDNARPLKRAHLGRSSQDRSLVLVRPEKKSEMIYAYFGSGIPASKVDFITPLTCEVRTLPKGPCRSVQQAEKLLKESKFVGRIPVDRVCQVANPLSEDLKFIMVFEGHLNVRVPETKVLFLASSNPSFLYIDDELVLQAPNVKDYWGTTRGQIRKEIQLKKGTHPFKMVAFSLENNPKFLAALGKCKMKGKEVAAVDFVAGNDFIQGGECVLKTVEGKNKRASVPQFWYKHISYISIDELGFLTETELGTYSGQEATWKFGDGSVMKGAKIKRIFSELNVMPVEATVKREKAKGRVVFSMIAPRQRKAENRKDFEYYTSIIKKQNVEEMDDAGAILPLLGYLQYQDNHDLQVPLAKAYIKARNARPKGTQEALFCLARAGSNNGKRNPAIKDATDSFVKLMKLNMEQDDRTEIVSEAVEYATFCLRDTNLAFRWLKSYGGRMGAKNRSSLLMDIYLQSGKLKEAAAEYQKLMEGKRFGAKQRSSAVRGSSFQEEAERAIQDGRIIAARRALASWAMESPMDRGNGSFSLVRARLFVKRGWLEGAEGELKGAIKADSELPNLPDVEFELAMVLRKLGKKDEARKLFTKIYQRYPNHPSAREAEKYAR